MPNLAPDWKFLLATLSKIEGLIDDVVTDTPPRRKIINELALVRVAIALENFLSRASYKIVAGAALLDGTVPVLTHRTATISAAETHLKTRGGTLPRDRPIPWLDAAELIDILKLALAPNDPCLAAIRAGGVPLAQIRKVRNHVAHSNRTSRTAFQQVVRQVYGSTLNAITPGTLLVTSRNGPRPLGKTLVISARVLGQNYCKGIVT